MSATPEAPDAPNAPDATGRWRLAGRRVLLTSGEQPAVVTIDGDRVTAVDTGHEAVAAALASDAIPVTDVGDRVVMPGVVDIHVHVNEPGRADWEGFEHAGRAAAAGGVTTIVDMPLNSEPVTTTPDAVASKVAAIARCRVDVGLWGGAVPANTGGHDARGLEDLLDAGVLGIKCFLVPSGLASFPPLDTEALARAMTVVAHRGAVLLAHAEWPGCLQTIPDQGAIHDAVTWAATRPPAAEVAAIERLIRGSRATGCTTHVVHLAAGEALPALKEARQDGVPISVETCPHYLFFDAPSVPPGATEYKCAPPLRDADNREALWRGLEAGTIDLVASDHSPCPSVLKCRERGDFAAAWGGVSSLQLLLPALWTRMRARGLGLDRLAHWLGAAPAERAGLGHRKGRIAVGCDADFVVWCPDAPFTVDGNVLHHRHPLTPYHGERLFGVVEQTWVRGQPVFARGHFPGEAHGRWLKREVGT